MVDGYCYYIQKKDGQAIFYDTNHNIVATIWLTDAEKNGDTIRLYEMLDKKCLNNFQPASIKIIKRKHHVHDIHYLDKHGNSIFSNGYPMDNIGDLKEIVEFEREKSSNRANINFTSMIDNNIPVVIAKKKKKCTIM